MIKQTILFATLLALLLCSCSSSKYGGGYRYEVTLDSQPSGAELFVLPRTKLLKMEEQGSPLDLEPHRVSQNGGLAPAEGVTLYGLKHVLIGRIDGASGRLEFVPTATGQIFVVPIVEP